MEEQREEEPIPVKQFVSLRACGMSRARAWTYIPHSVYTLTSAETAFVSSSKVDHPFFLAINLRG